MMPFMQKLKDALVLTDEEITQVRLGGVVMSFAMFFMLVGISSMDRLSTIAGAAINMQKADTKIKEALINQSKLEKETAALSNQLPYSQMLTKTKEANVWLKSKIMAFNKSNSFGIIVTPAGETKCDGINPYYTSTVDFNGTQGANAVVALIYFEKIGYIDSFDGRRMHLNFRITQNKEK